MFIATPRQNLAVETSFSGIQAATYWFILMNGVQMIRFEVI